MFRAARFRMPTRSTGASAAAVREVKDATGALIMEKRQFAGFVAGDLGLTRPAAQSKDGTAHSMPLSLEALADIDGEWLFVSTLTEDGRQTLDEVRQTPAFKELKAVKNDHVVSVNGSVWSTRGAPLAAGIVIDDLVKAMAAG